jgi:hypothetical protein
VYHLPTGAPEREIRLVEVNDQIVERGFDPLESLDFGVDVGTPDCHTLLVVDVTPSQWKRVEVGELRLPDSWSLEGKKPIRRTKRA